MFDLFRMKAFVGIIAIACCMVACLHSSVQYRKLNLLGTFSGPETIDITATPGFTLANEQSYGFYYDVPEHDWQLKREIAQSMPLTHPWERLDHIDRTPDKFGDWYLNNYLPNFTCQFERRVGEWKLGDGAKWVCDPHRLRYLSEQRKKEGKRGCIVYSVGSNGNFRFEEAIQQLLGPETCEVHVFDFGDFESEMPSGLNIFYHQWGLTSKSQSDGTNFATVSQSELNFKSFAETMKVLGHEEDTIDILKIDCEGCEWDEYKGWIEADVRQVLVETHGVPPNAHDFFQGHDKAGYVMFHKEPNTIGVPGCCEEFGYVKLHPDFKNKPLEVQGSG